MPRWRKKKTRGRKIGCKLSDSLSTRTNKLYER